MSDKYPGKTVIGLTGNIATGKSVVRRMLEHNGALGIDADGLSHRAMSPGAPAHKPVAELFGRWVVAADGQINRQRLATIVFNDSDALEALEAIVHPLVRQAVDVLIRRSKQPLIVIEAIKLFESPLAAFCDAIWVVDAPEQVRLERLTRDRKMSEKDARMRMASQPPQAEKLARASVIINNSGGYENTYEQVQEHLKTLLEAGGQPAPAAVAEEEATVVVPQEPSTTQVKVRRGSPRDAEQIAAFISKVTGRKVTGSDVMLRYGEQAYMLAFADEQIVGLAGLQVENLIARVSDFLLVQGAPVDNTVKSLIKALEDAISVLQGEIALIFVPNSAPDQAKRLFVSAGYEPRRITDLNVPDWREAAQEAAPKVESVLFAKKLRTDRVLKPL